ncbi:MAG: hypothetical protein JSV61_11910 [Anaerolineales bacterium]|nr:MAG: hypothetical protein JSV61_11910 [Anaerolineales bacterium]
MAPFLFWYISISVLGWLSFPLAYRLLPALPDRGFIFSRTLGLLLWVYVFWLLASLQILPNTLGGILLALLVLAALSIWLLRKSSPSELISWMRKHLGLLLFVEVLFLLSFAGMAYVRAANPEIMGTEKPMELAFINAILSSTDFPPHDPWLSGYAISYYYFGYVMVAALARLTAVPGNIAFNLGVALVFALGVLGAYGIVYNLLSKLGASGKASSKATWTFSALLGPLFVFLVSNVEGFLEVLHARGFFWQESASGQLVSGFWHWLDMRELSQPPAQPFSWLPNRYLWWWRASRVVQDYDFAGNWKEVIDEFPVFTFILSDLHPHVLAMPFAFLAIALALNLFYGGGAGTLGWLRRSLDRRTTAGIAVILLSLGFGSLWLAYNTLSLRAGVISVLSLLGGAVLLVNLALHLRLYGQEAITQAELNSFEVGFALQLSSQYLLLSCVVLGGLAFLNTWDFPFYIALFSGAYVLARQHGRLGPESILRPKISTLARDFFGLSLVLALGGVILYLPFYLSFSSQLGGILPNLVYPTRGTHLWVMFATLLLPILAYLVYLWLNMQGKRYRPGFLIAIGLGLALWVLSLFLSVGILLIPEVSDLFMGSLGASEVRALLTESLLRRLEAPGGWITLLLLLGLVIALLWSQQDDHHAAPNERGLQDDTHRFSLLLILLGTLLVLGPEYFYLRDLFGWRINTIFKFYYQAWIFWGTAAGYAVVVLLLKLRGFFRYLFQVGLIGILLVGLTYTVLGLNTKTNGFQPPEGFTLDGTAYLERQAPDEMAAIAWLRQAPAGVVAESVGGSYSVHARVSELSGKPTVLGWDFHEVQWRGESSVLGSRQSDIQRLYCTNDWVEAQQIIDLYDIRYIYIGNLERITFLPEKCPGGLDERKFQRNLAPVFQQGEVSIYAVP